jgi:hypothetical protein
VNDRLRLAAYELSRRAERLAELRAIARQPPAGERAFLLELDQAIRAAMLIVLPGAAYKPQPVRLQLDTEARAA